MKKTIVIILLTTVWILLFIVGFNKHRNNVTSVTSIQQSDTTVNKELLKREDYPSKESFMSAVLEKFDVADIYVYGKLIDQYGKPVPDADVKGLVSTSTGWMKEKNDRYETKSNEKGLFSFQGLRGGDIGLAFYKDGYEFRRIPGDNGTWLRFSRFFPKNERHVPDPANPVVFKMWKFKGPEGLLLGDRGTQVPVNGEKVRFDLIKAEDVKEGGDIIVSYNQIIKDKNDKESYRKYDWTATLESVDGGFIEIDKSNQYDNEAPENGYIPKVTITVSATEKYWSGCETREMYFKTRNGQVYGKLKWEMYAGYDRPTTLASFTTKLNPNGSRNLEYDFYKELKWDEDQQKLVDAHSKEMMDALIRKAEEMDKMSNRK